MLINELFKENKFRLFVRYCNDHGIITIHDINQIDFDDLANMRGIGNKKIEDIKEKLKSIQLSNADSFDDCICEIYPKEIPLEEMAIKDVFAENKYNLFMQYCKKKGFEKIQDLQTLDLVELSSTKGFGKKKIDDIVLKIKEFPQDVINLENRLNSFDKVSDEMKAIDIFALTEMGVSKQALRKLQGKGIYTLDDLVKTEEIPLVQEIGRGNLNKVKKAVEF